MRDEVGASGRGRRAVGRLALIAGAWVLMLGLSGCDALRVFFPSSDHDEVAPELPAALGRPAVLVFSKTNGFRHDEAIDAGVPALESALGERGYQVFATENGAVHTPELLARFDAVVWFQVSGDVLDEAQRAALIDYAEAGGGFVGVHGTGGDWDYTWPDHPGRLVRAQFIGHPMGPQFQEGTIHVEAPAHPVMRGVPGEWTRTEEWYSFERSPRGEGVQVLATLDESTYSPRMKILFMDTDIAMGDDHPIVWAHCLGRGRAVYSALGHLAEAYSEAPHLAMLGNAVEWVAERPAEGCGVR